MKRNSMIKEENLNSVNSEPLQLMRAQGIDIYYGNALSAKEIYDEVFIQKIYNFDTNKEKPIIIDAGSNIGIATLFFKNKYPLSKVICFEPDPNAFLILQKNISVNNLKNVVAINTALSRNNGVTPFYGEVSGVAADSRGNSIMNAWGTQRETSAKILVNSQRLSDYIQEEIDFLKIDIEGAEQQVLEELGNKLRFIKEMVIEVHEIEAAYFDNSLEKIKSILNHYNFRITTQINHINDSLPGQIQHWVKKVHPIFTMLKAIRF